ncbi:zinc finger protein 383-like [Condylostylus longicornis]|uniref:zinc finger protein 383-like n=1 Tax=Condylostylus longicornis TaxID=2530218 RepID=UPI00244D9D51|nr:zinc finger protein 383-like [Condylostylus longicornis]
MAQGILKNASQYEDIYKCRLQSLCRLCLLQDRELDLNSDSYLPNKKWIDILFSVTNNDYEKTNSIEYPQGICKECSSKLVLFYKFKQKVTASYKKLQNIFKHNDIKSMKSSNNNIEYIEECENGNARDDFVNVNDLTENTSRSYDEICETNSVATEMYSTNEEESGSLCDLIKIDDPGDNKKFLCYLDIYEKKDKGIENGQLNFNEKQELFNDNLDENSFSCHLEIENIGKKTKKSKNIQCDKCGAKFTRNSSLRQHDTVHSTEKKFECNLCKKKFTRRAHVDIHMLIHSNIRPHSCQICSRAFTKSGDLKRHQKIHSDVYEFVCLICNKEFKRKEYLATHVNTHYGVKPHKCKNCGKCYQSLSGLLKHTKNVHSQKINF